MRNRLRTEGIADCLTFSKYINMHSEEPVILHYCLEKHPYLHWVEHIESLPRHINGDSPTYHIREKFNELKLLIRDTLKNSNFKEQASEIEMCKNEDQLNNTIIRQYTEESELYRVANQKLRDCHLYQNVKSKIDDTNDEFLAPWILQLSSCIKKLSHYRETCYRGTTLTADEIKLYKKDKLFIWASFVSASKTKEQCFGGNVLFEIDSRNHFNGLNDKAYPRDISTKSVYPEEDEVLFPIACAYRVEGVRKIANMTIITLNTIDYN